MDPFRSIIDNTLEERTARPSRTNRTFYLDDDVYDWMKSRFGDSRGISNFVREVLRKCKDSDSLENRDD